MDQPDFQDEVLPCIPPEDPGDDAWHHLQLLGAESEEEERRVSDEPGAVCERDAQRSQLHRRICSAVGGSSAGRFEGT